MNHADLKGLEKISFHFELGKPFKPFEQLMGVLPVASMENVPLAYQVCHPRTVSYYLEATLLPGSHVRCEFPNPGLLSP